MVSIRHEDEDLKMPKAGAMLDDKVIADFAKWIDGGAFDPRDQSTDQGRTRQGHRMEDGAGDTQGLVGFQKSEG